MPTLLKDRSNAEEMVIVIAIPLLFGALAGWMLGVSEPVYVALTLLGILGGLAAGLEHEYGLEGFYRGLLGGLLFGFGILFTHGVIGAEAKAHLIEPEVVLIGFTAAFGAGLGALGGRMRERRTKKEAAESARESRRSDEPRFTTENGSAEATRTRSKETV
jgi:hypothetical protein